MTYLRPTLLAAALLISLPALAQSPPPVGCAAKRHAIEEEIAYAKAYGNSRQVAGLQTALEAVRNNCSDAGLKAEHDARIADKKRKVAERKADLEQARASGNANKIAERQSKLTQAETELEQARLAP